MVSKDLAKVVRALAVASAAALIHCAGVSADDTEIYQATVAASEARPQVLIIFDDSGSMNEVLATPPPYDPEATYNGTPHSADRVYWSVTNTPPATDSTDYILVGDNRCAESIGPLAEQGQFQSKALRWFPGRVELGLPAGWERLALYNALDLRYMDCEKDVIEGNPGNPGAANGYPQETTVNGQEYGPAPDPSLDWQPATAPVTYFFFSAHYMDWYYDDTLVLDHSTKLEIAKEAVTELVAENTQIDFGLALYNDNANGGNYDGGRIVHRLIPDMNAGQRTDLTDALNGTIAAGFTPLCEATMEVYRYLGGHAVVYGNEKHPVNDPEPKDQLAENPAGTYSPPASPCGNVFVILMTDGLPTYDPDANAEIEALTGKTCQDYLNGFDPPSNEKSCLPEIAEYMANNDLDRNPANGEQFAVTYTIGFGLEEDEQILIDTAARGDGLYYAASTAQQLAEAFSGAIAQILATESTLTSPSLAVDTFSRTESRDEVLFAMFKPDRKVNWPGNIKRLDIDFGTGEAVLVDQARDPALDPATGQISRAATTVWSIDLQDGPDVTRGGLGARLQARDPATRTLYSNTGNDEALQPYGPENMTAEAFGYEDDAALYALFGVASGEELDTVLDWGAGYDVADEDQDGDVDDTRWILADMLHSQPLLVNYGARTNSFSREDPDLRIVVGTNAGFLHMFGNADGEEDWAFFAKELAPVLNKRRQNAVSSQHVYGIDSPAVLYTRDVNRDGNIIATADPATSDRAYVYFGLRRGGRILYAMDISEPDSPELLWRIDNTMPGFSELGQTWSQPVVTHIPGYRDEAGVSKPVLVFGAGFDVNKDTHGLVTPDTMGRGLFIVDAQTGALVWSVTPAADSATNMQEPRLFYSMAAPVTVLDSNGDELTDRIYMADTGGQLWRVDLPGSSLPDANQDDWRIIKMADMNNGNAATDRRFFNAPDIVRTSYSGVAFDAILIGSGDRTHPNEMGDPDDPNVPAVNNQFYMIRDLATKPYFTAAPSFAQCNADPPSVDFRCQLPVGSAELYDVTANLIEIGNAEQQAAAREALANSRGWRFDLLDDGEKSLSRSVTIGGKVYFTTFTPAAPSENVCEPAAGIGRLYVLDLLTASAVEDFDANGNTDRSWIIGSLLPDTPAPYFGPDGEIRLLLPPGSGGEGAIGSPFLTGSSIPRPYGSYWFQEEY